MEKQEKQATPGTLSELLKDMGDSIITLSEAVRKSGDLILTIDERLQRIEGRVSNLESLGLFVIRDKEEE